jgi:hypothetical protein
VPVEEVTKISLNVSGEVTGNLTLKAEKLKFSVNGSGDMKVAADATANLTVSENIKIHAKNLLTVKIVGFGDVMVNKDFATVNKKIVGSCEVSKY